MTFYLGIDPDLHHTGVAVLGPEEGIVCTALVHGRAKGEQANILMAESIARVINDDYARHDCYMRYVAVVESQRIRPGSKVNPQDIVMLAQAAGAAVGACVRFIPTADISLVEPQDWKGSIPKEAHHAVIRDHFGLTEGQFGKHESHLLDAIGLAAWGQLRDLLPRAADRPSQISLSGSVLSRQRLSRLPRLKIRAVPTLP